MNELVLKIQDITFLVTRMSKCVRNVSGLFNYYFKTSCLKADNTEEQQEKQLFS